MKDYLKKGQLNIKLKERSPRFSLTVLFAGASFAILLAALIIVGAAALILMFTVTWNGTVPRISIVRENFPDLISWGLFAAAVVASMVFKVGPIKIIVAGGVLGLLLY